jgi:hypothetical protein
LPRSLYSKEDRPKLLANHSILEWKAGNSI